jgi:hypothetical protein
MNAQRIRRKDRFALAILELFWPVESRSNAGAHEGWPAGKPQITMRGRWHAPER